MKNKTAALLIAFVLIATLLVAGGFAEEKEIAGVLKVFKADPPIIEVSSAGAAPAKFTWTEETIFLNRHDEELTPVEFYRQFKDQGVMVFYEGNMILRIEPSYF